MISKKTATISVLPLVVLFACERPETTPPPAPQASQVPLGRAQTVAPGGGDTTGKAAAENNREVAVLAGGCFWGMEDILREIDGVLDTEVGYAGGGLASPSYEDVKKGDTGHAESVRIVFDPTKISFEELLEKWFFRMHDPTTKDRQGNDVGSQYRSAIFFTSPAQKRIAERVIEKVSSSGQWDEPIVTEVTAAGEFTPAEDYHQDYLEKNPGGYTCHYLRDPVH